MAVCPDLRLQQIAHVAPWFGMACKQVMNAPLLGPTALLEQVVRFARLDVENHGAQCVSAV
jgi:hypothetical protein